jgi:hypothetical protein
MQCLRNPTHWKMGHGKIACSVLPDSMLDVAGNGLYELQAANDAVFEVRHLP